MKTYSTIEDILNDHELMAKEYCEISKILISESVSNKLYNSIPQNPFSQYAREVWLKSEYERRNKIENIVAKHFDLAHKQALKNMEKKPNLIPFDLEKAKAGAKVFNNIHEGEIVFESKDDLLIVFDDFSRGHYSSWYKKGSYENLFIESEPLPEIDTNWCKVYDIPESELKLVRICEEKPEQKEFYKIAKLKFE